MTKVVQPVGKLNFNELYDIGVKDAKARLRENEGITTFGAFLRSMLPSESGFGRNVEKITTFEEYLRQRLPVESDYSSNDEYDNGKEEEDEYAFLYDSPISVMKSCSLSSSPPLGMKGKRLSFDSPQIDNDFYNDYSPLSEVSKKRSRLSEEDEMEISPIKKRLLENDIDNAISFDNLINAKLNLIPIDANNDDTMDITPLLDESPQRYTNGDRSDKKKKKKKKEKRKVDKKKDKKKNKKKEKRDTGGIRKRSAPDGFKPYEKKGTNYRVQCLTCKIVMDKRITWKHTHSDEEEHD